VVYRECMMRLLTSTSSRVPRSHAVLAVDIVGSSRVSDDRLDTMKCRMETYLGDALNAVELSLDDAVHPRDTGDGVLLAYPENDVAKLVELVFHLDHLLRWHNREYRNPLRARVAVHCGPLGDEGRYHRPYIVATRLLSAPAFTASVAHCVRQDPYGDKLGAALVVSRWVWNSIVEPFRVALVPPGRCARIGVHNPDFTDEAWIHLPGSDADVTLAAVERETTLPASSGRDTEVVPAVPFRENHPREHRTEFPGVAGEIPHDGQAAGGDGACGAGTGDPGCRHGATGHPATTPSRHGSGR
jgi:hypothetical protein